MNQNSDPLESIIDFAWSAGADLFFVQNAKDELKKLKETSYPKSNDSIDKLIDLCETAIKTGKWHLTPSLINDAKANLAQIRKSKKEWAQEVYRANEFAVEKTNEYLEICQQMQTLKNSLES